MKFDVKRNFDFVKLNKEHKKAVKTFSQKNLDDVVEQLKQNIVRETHFDEPIHEITRSVRLVRGNTSSKALIDSVEYQK